MPQTHLSSTRKVILKSLEDSLDDGVLATNHQCALLSSLQHQAKHALCSGPLASAERGHDSNIAVTR
jgi:hypothetical protein